MHIPMSSPDLNDADIQAVNQVLQTRYHKSGARIWTALGRGAILMPVDVRCDRRDRQESVRIAHEL